ncbi:S-adenosyl-L-methionine-dependent methyltransferase [Nemania sp. NC0429]|nr:S-adenosyl-L-methionine-dependent methyltransferase [Nemania sp. NC0429]
MASSDTAAVGDPASSDAPIKVKLSPLEKTMIMTLWLRAREAASPNPVLGDMHAQKILDRVDTASLNPAMLPSDRRYDEYLNLRTKQLDEWCRGFLEAHADEPVTVLHLACGLDLRAMRLRPSCGENVRWIDLDRPEVANLRRRLIPDPFGVEGEGRGREWDYRLIGASVSDDGWTEEVPQDRPLLVIAEGLFVYLAPEEAAAILRRLVERAPSGGQLVMDAIGSILTRYQSLMPVYRGSDVRLRWGVDDGEEVAKAHPRLRLAETVMFRDLLPGVFGSRAPPCFGVLTPLFSLLPSWRTYSQLLRLEF